VRVPSLVRERPLMVISVVWLLASFLAGPLGPDSVISSFHWKVGPIHLGRPVVTSGDSPHYLVLVNSLIEDGDFDVSNNYDRAEAGDWSQGTRHRGVALDRHVDVDLEGRQLLYHPPFLPLLLAVFTWPFRGTQWVESACIWLTMGIVLWSLHWLRRIRPEVWSWPLLVAFSTPVWWYSRDLWTEPWMMAAWIGLFAFRNPVAQAGFAGAGILMKYSFAVVPVTLGLVAVWRRDYRKALVLLGATVLTLAAAISFIQYLFWNVDHFGLFHSGAHQFRTRTFVVAPFGLRWGAVPGLLFSARDGLLPFVPFLIWGFWRLRKGGEFYLPAVSFFLLNASFLGWRAGTGFSARYLIPMVPVLVLGALEEGPRRRRLFAAAVIYSTLLCSLGGLMPAGVVDRSPLDIVLFLTGRSLEYLGLQVPETLGR
jgi:hypothetical protein